MKKLNKQFLLLGIVALTALGTVACGNNGPTPEQIEAEKQQKVNDAADFLFQSKKKEEITPITYVYDNKLEFVNLGTFTVEWSITLGEGVAENLIKAEKKLTTTSFTIDMAEAGKLTEPASYTVFAKVSDEEGRSATKKFDRKVPTLVKKTVAEFHKLPASEKDFYKLEGVISSVNKVGKAGSFTITDETGTLFSYSGANVTLGSQVSLIGVRADYSGFAQLDKVTLIEAGTENKLNTLVNENTITTITMEKVDEILASFSNEETKAATIAEYSPKYYKITGGYLVKNGSGYLGLNKTAGNAGVTEDKTINIYYHSNSSISGNAGSLVDCYCAIRGFGNSYLTVQVLHCVPAGQAVTF